MNNTTTLAQSAATTGYVLELYYLLIIVLSAFVGICFSLACLIRFLREPKLRTHFNYLFHYVIIFCIIGGLFSGPYFIAGYDLILFQKSIEFCHLHVVTGYFYFIAIPTTICFTSIERHVVMFRRNGVLTWKRQLIPFSLIILYCFLVVCSFALIPQCNYLPCVPCTNLNVHILLAWQTCSFILPLIITMLSTLAFLFRLYNYFNEQARIRNGIDKQQSKTLKIVAIQAIIYLLWCSVVYCPPNIYNFLVAYNSKRYTSSLMKTIGGVISNCGLQAYPIITFFLFKSTTKSIYAQSTSRNTNKSPQEQNTTST
ncbi:unnamed protein product [Didymodactylos carnosus]|uniref:G-protein coupled receptors family 1 profile domain-containing protein n=1 Tax=Didymodactylos carnosus TaxID=1234261 RepID=A0A814XDK3_9BILA|nr:unnamed protein product [Didymodactylos carnosus]CAF1217884.1 unnamed protein product [Didymodactylos carnosus]CAF3884629.1 unnamed protein product [Didymodactylos carnosus]CAF3981452.1 unnamed protein product [Didymodactylos carnosus]